MKNISILGAGWLGAPLAQRLKEGGHRLRVSTTSREKLAEFEHEGMASFLIDTDQPIEGRVLDAFLDQTDLLIITIPPGRNRQSSDGHYIDRIKPVIPFMEKHGVREVIFTSSTTVYLSLQGEVNESTPISPASEMDKQIVEIEELFMHNPHFNTSVLRLAALIGGDRHPVRYIVQREVVEDANNPVNMVHREDIIRFIDKMVELPIPNEIFNLAAPIFLNRRDFYTREAARLGLSPLPVFKDNPEADRRRVSGGKISERYGLEYLYLL